MFGVEALDARGEVSGTDTPFVPLMVFTLIPTGRGSPRSSERSKSDSMVKMASALFRSICCMAQSGSSLTPTRSKYPEAVQVSISFDEAIVRLLSTTTRSMLRISMLTANGNTSIISTGKAMAILGRPGSLKNCLNSFSNK